MLAWINSHKTKLIGVVGVVYGYLQLPANQEVINHFLSPDAKALAAMLIGAATVAIGFLNPKAPTAPATQETPPNAS